MARLIQKYQRFCEELRRLSRKIRIGVATPPIVKVSDKLNVPPERLGVTVFFVFRTVMVL